MPLPNVSDEVSASGVTVKGVEVKSTVGKVFAPAAYREVIAVDGKTIKNG